MDKEQIKVMDPYMLFSILNMKLRDEFNSLEALCEDFNIEKEIIEERLKSIGYVYSKESNQFI